MVTELNHHIPTSISINLSLSSSLLSLTLYLALKSFYLSISVNQIEFNPINNLYVIHLGVALPLDPVQLSLVLASKVLLHLGHLCTNIRMDKLKDWMAR